MGWSSSLLAVVTCAVLWALLLLTLTEDSQPLGRARVHCMSRKLHSPSSVRSRRNGTRQLLSTAVGSKLRGLLGMVPPKHAAPSGSILQGLASDGVEVVMGLTPTGEDILLTLIHRSAGTGHPRNGLVEIYTRPAAPFLSPAPRPGEWWQVEAPPTTSPGDWTLCSREVVGGSVEGVSADGDGRSMTIVWREHLEEHSQVHILALNVSGCAGDRGRQQWQTLHGNSGNTSGSDRCDTSDVRSKTDVSIPGNSWVTAVALCGDTLFYSRSSDSRVFRTYRRDIDGQWFPGAPGPAVEDQLESPQGNAGRGSLIVATAGLACAPRLGILRTNTSDESGIGAADDFSRNRGVLALDVNGNSASFTFSMRTYQHRQAWELDEQWQRQFTAPAADDPYPDTPASADKPSAGSGKRGSSKEGGGPRAASGSSSDDGGGSGGGAALLDPMQHALLTRGANLLSDSHTTPSRHTAIFAYSNYLITMDTVAVEEEDGEEEQEEEAEDEQQQQQQQEPEIKHPAVDADGAATETGGTATDADDSGSQPNLIFEVGEAREAEAGDHISNAVDPEQLSAVVVEEEEEEEEETEPHSSGSSLRTRVTYSATELLPSGVSPPFNPSLNRNGDTMLLVHRPAPGDGGTGSPAARAAGMGNGGLGKRHSSNSSSRRRRSSRKEREAPQVTSLPPTKILLLSRERAHPLPLEPAATPVATPSAPPARSLASEAQRGDDAVSPEEGRGPGDNGGYVWRLFGWGGSEAVPENAAVEAVAAAAVDGNLEGQQQEHEQEQELEQEQEQQELEQQEQEHEQEQHEEQQQGQEQRKPEVESTRTDSGPAPPLAPPNVWSWSHTVLPPISLRGRDVLATLFAPTPDSRLLVLYEGGVLVSFDYSPEDQDTDDGSDGDRPSPLQVKHEGRGHDAVDISVVLVISFAGLAGSLGWIDHPWLG